MITQRITQLRRTSGLTQQDMADKMNKSVSSYNRLERGETMMTIEDMEQIAGIFNIPITELLAHVKPAHPNQAGTLYPPTDSAKLEKLFEEIHEIKALLLSIRQGAA